MLSCSPILALLLLLVIPAKAGIQLFLVLLLKSGKAKAGFPLSRE
jgi:hypothetical protein